jgi:DNA-binding response OmpR family regulator
MSKILIVEDNENIRESISNYLKIDGHDVFESNKISGVYEKIKNNDFDLLILDIMLPDGNGYNLLKKIRLKYDIPVIILSARTSESDRIIGFEIGCNDYVVKPFSYRELILRVNSLLKYTKSNSINNKDQIYKYKKSILKLNCFTHKITVDEKEIYLTSIEWKIFCYLIRNKGLVITRDKLIEECIDIASDSTERAIDAHIKKIRSKLNTHDWIKTIRGFGYKFIGENIK